MTISWHMLVREGPRNNMTRIGIKMPPPSRKIFSLSYLSVLSFWRITFICDSRSFSYVYVAYIIHILPVSLNSHDQSLMYPDLFYIFVPSAMFYCSAWFLRQIKCNYFKLYWLCSCSLFINLNERITDRFVNSWLVRGCTGFCEGNRIQLVGSWYCINISSQFTGYTGYTHGEPEM
jgi:hypothetical protein